MTKRFEKQIVSLCEVTPILSSEAGIWHHFDVISIRLKAHVAELNFQTIKSRLPKRVANFNRYNNTPENLPHI